MGDEEHRTDRQEDDDQAPDETMRDLGVPADEADKVKGGAVGPCDRSRQ